MESVQTQQERDRQTRLERRRQQERERRARETPEERDRRRSLRNQRDRERRRARCAARCASALAQLERVCTCISIYICELAHARPPNVQHFTSIVVLKLHILMDIYAWVQYTAAWKEAGPRLKSNSAWQRRPGSSRETRNIYILGMRTRIFFLALSMVDVYVRTYHLQTIPVYACVHAYTYTWNSTYACVHVYTYTCNISP